MPAMVSVNDIADIGKRLTQPPSSKDSLCKLLKQATSLFNGINQTEQQRVLPAMKPSVDALVQPGILKHKDKDVRLLVAACISEVMRIVAPDAPYSDEDLRDIFELIVSSFKGLNNTSSPHFERRVTILETVANVRSCVVMLDLECDDLIQEMFQIFFLTTSEEHKLVMDHMKTIMCLVLEESEEVPKPLVELLLGNLLSGSEGVSKAARDLARSVIKPCSAILEPQVHSCLVLGATDEKSSESRWRDNHEDLIFELYTCAPSLLVPLIPKLTEELLTDQIDVRLKAAKLLGRLFASETDVSDLFEQLYVEFIKRFTDKAIEVRLAMIQCTEQCLLANPNGPRTKEFLGAISDRLQDFDEGVRRHAVVAIAEIAQMHPQLLLVDELKRLAERMRDTEVSVRRETMQQLISLYRSFCSKKVKGANIETNNFYWIPSKLIRCYFDPDSKEFRAQGMELVFSEQLFPVGFPVNERVKCWVSFFSDFESNDVKALERILQMKQRLQLEMQKYLALQQKLKHEESLENERRLEALCKSMASSFVDPQNAEKQLRKLVKIKDSKLFRDLVELLDPDTSLPRSFVVQADLLKLLGEKHPLHEFLKLLTIKCSYILFGKRHMKFLLGEIKELKRSEDDKLLKASMGLFVVFANQFPNLVDGVEGDVMDLLNDDRDFLQEGAVQVLAKVGGLMKGRFTEQSNQAALLEKLCTEGNRKQAKYAVQALSVMSNDSGFNALSGLYRKLLDLLESGINLPTVLQSLGCIAQQASSVFEKHEEDLVRILVNDLFKKETTCADSKNIGDHSVGEATQLKVFGIKTLVRSFLPNKDSQQLQRCKGLFGILSKFLESGKSADMANSSISDKALRLAAAIAVLRLSKRYDAQIPAQVFHETILCAKDPFEFVRGRFLSKVHKLLRERSIPPKYACALILGLDVASDKSLAEAGQQLAEFVKSSRRQARLWDSGEADTPSIEYVLFYLVHSLAQEAVLPKPLKGGQINAEAVEPYIIQLSFFLWALLDHDEERVQFDEMKQEDRDQISLVLGILRVMKKAEDVLDPSKTENTYILCDIAIKLLQLLIGIDLSDMKTATIISLPTSIYKSVDAADGEEKLDGSPMPAIFADDAAFLSMMSNLPFSLKGGTKALKRKADDALSEKQDKQPQKRSKVGENASHNLPLGEAGNGWRQKQSLKSNTTEKKAGTKEASRDAEVGIGITSPKKSKGQDPSTENEDEKATLSSLVPLAGRKRKGKLDEAVQEKADLGAKQERHGKRSKETVVKEGSPKLGTDTGGGSTSSKQKDGPLPPLENDNETLSSMMRKQGKPKLSVKVDEGVEDGLNTEKSPTPKTTGLLAEVATPGADDLTRRHVRISIKKPKPPSEPTSGAFSLEEHADAKQRPAKRAKDSPHDDAEAQADQVRLPRGVSKKRTKKMHTEADKKGKTYGEELLNKRVRVWWPLDKRFYPGTIEEYDAEEKVHHVFYDDGDKEILNMAKEQWELIEDEEDDMESTPSKTLAGRKRKGKLDEAVQEKADLGAKQERHCKHSKETVVKEGSPKLGTDTGGGSTSSRTPHTCMESGCTQCPNSKADKKGKTYGEELLYKRVRVWWPLDKRFYPGTIEEYDAEEKIHHVFYDDGDKEILNMAKEQWELIEDEEDVSLFPSDVIILISGC